MSDSFYNIVAWILVMTGLLGIIMISGIVIWLIIQELNK